MSQKTLRKVVVIDEEKCDGCGACIPNCAEGAIRVIEGKARLIDDRLCDGLGNCLGTCPRGAITIEQRVAAAFDERLAARIEGPPATHGGRHAAQGRPAESAAGASAEPLACACPGAALRKLDPFRGSSKVSPADSRLGHWPVQLHLLPIESPLWQDRDLLIAADCVGFAMPDFHARLLAGRTLAVGCPKLDDTHAYAEKLAAVFSRHRIRSVTVAHMEVPCCLGIVRLVREALEAAGRPDVPLQVLTIGVDGTIVAG